MVMEFLLHPPSTIHHPPLLSARPALVALSPGEPRFLRGRLLLLLLFLLGGFLAGLLLALARLAEAAPLRQELRQHAQDGPAAAQPVEQHRVAVGPEDRIQCTKPVEQ